MKKFTHIAIVAAAALAVTGCSVHTDDPTPVEEVYAAEILTPTAESSLTTTEVATLKAAAAGVFADKIIDGNDYIWLSIEADDYDVDVTKLNPNSSGYCYDSATNLRLCYLGDNLSLLCEVIRYDIEAEAGYIDNTITPVAYHYYPDAEEHDLYTLKSTYYMQERYATYRKADAQGNYPTEFFDEPLTDFITGESYKHLRLDRYFMKNGHEFHIMLYSQIFDEVEEDGKVLYAMKDPNGIVIIRRVDENGNDVMDELLYSPSNELSYTMERTFLDLNFDYAGFD